MAAVREYLQARPVYERTAVLDGTVYYHGRFRGFAAEPHAHPTVQLLIPLSGRMHLVAGDRSHLLGPEWGALVFGNVPHAFTHLDGELAFAAVDAPTSLLEAWAAALGVPAPTGEALVVREPRLWQLGQQLAAELEQEQPGMGPMLESGLQQMGVHFLRALARPPAQPMAKEPKVLRAVDRILKDFAEELSVEDLAAELAMSARHFERCFKEAVGMGPKRFLLEVRVSAGRELLATTDQAISAIALDVGFKTPSHFAETFLKLVGTTPSAYRATNKA